MGLHQQWRKAPSGLRTPLTFYFRIDASDEEESNPRASAQEALDDCFAACREEAWADSSGDPNEWFAAFKEDPFGPAHKSNLIRVA